MQGTGQSRRAPLDAVACLLPNCRRELFSYTLVIYTVADGSPAALLDHSHKGHPTPQVFAGVATLRGAGYADPGWPLPSYEMYFDGHATPEDEAARLAFLRAVPPRQCTFPTRLIRSPSSCLAKYLHIYAARVPPKPRRLGVPDVQLVP